MALLISYISPWVVFLHVVSAFTFFLAHGVSVFMSIRVPQETNLDRLRGILDLSSYSLGMLYISLLGILLTGFIAGGMGGFWSKGWIWLSLILLILITFLMIRFSRAAYNPLRKAIGLPHFAGPGKPVPGVEPQSAEEILALARATNPGPFMAVGYIGLIIIVWLMMFKPF
jgi:hypothetical protein